MKLDEVFGLFNKADKRADAARERVRAKEKKKSDDATAAKEKKARDAETLKAVDDGIAKRAKSSNVKNTQARNLKSD